jgi:rhodanese-related sulfurtransferase
MDRLLEFAMAHPVLVGSFMLLLTALLALENRRSGKSVTSQQLTNLVNAAGAVVVDVRDAKEFRDGHITDSRNIPYSQLQDKISELSTFKDKPVILVCKMGQHAGAAGRMLTKAGFTDVRRLSGGIATWTADRLPLVKKG